MIQLVDTDDSTGKSPIFSELPREGESAISCQYGPACDNDPIVGLKQAFGADRTPRAGEYYRQTTTGDILDSSRTPVYDGGQIVDNKLMPPGHLSIYGNNDPESFNSIWEVSPFSGK